MYNELCKPYRPSLIKIPEPKYRNHGNAFISFGSPWDIDDDFTSYADDTAFAVVYPTSNATYQHGDATNDRIEYNYVINTDKKSLVRNFGSTISDTAHITRFKWNITAKTLDPTGNDCPMTIGWSDANQTEGGSDNGDGLGVTAYQDNLARNYWGVYADGTDFDGQIGAGTFGTMFSKVATIGDDFFWQEIRESATAWNTGFFSDEYVTLTEETDTVIPSTVVNLQYFKMAGADDVTDPQGTQDGNVHNYLRFRDGVTVPP